MDGKLLVVTATLSLLITITKATEFSTQPQTPLDPAAAVSSPARCDTECALKCSAAEPATCSAFVFVPQSKLCLMSAAKGADFSAAAPNSPAYRRLTDYRQSYVTIGSRQFRIIQHRSKGDLSFARSWTDYENGFGDDTDFWIGLKTIHKLTGNTPRLLRVEAVAWSDALSVCEYSNFTVGDASTNYTMTFGSYLGGSSNTSEDTLTFHKGMQFSTMDRDNDADSSRHCSTTFGNGGWWFKDCFEANPNGIYRYSAVSSSSYMSWKGAISGVNVALKSVRFMLQRD